MKEKLREKYALTHPDDMDGADIHACDDHALRCSAENGNFNMTKYLEIVKYLRDLLLIKKILFKRSIYHEKSIS